MGESSKLTARFCATATDGWHSDGGCLYLRVDSGRKRWIVRITRDRVKKDYGVGGYETTSLALARRKRDAILDQLREGIDPIEAKRQARIDKRIALDKRTFRDAVEQVIKNRAPFMANDRGPHHQSRRMEPATVRRLQSPVADAG